MTLWPEGWVGGEYFLDRVVEIKLEAFTDVVWGNDRSIEEPSAPDIWMDIESVNETRIQLGDIVDEAVASSLHSFFLWRMTFDFISLFVNFISKGFGVVLLGILWMARISFWSTVFCPAFEK